MSVLILEEMLRRLAWSGSVLHLRREPSHRSHRCLVWTLQVMIRELSVKEQAYSNCPDYVKMLALDCWFQDISTRDVFALAVKGIHKDKTQKECNDRNATRLYSHHDVEILNGDIDFDTSPILFIRVDSCVVGVVVGVGVAVGFMKEKARQS
jgi:hypothetical protein